MGKQRIAIGEPVAVTKSPRLWPGVRQGHLSGYIYPSNQHRRFCNIELCRKSKFLAYKSALGRHLIREVRGLGRFRRLLSSEIPAMRLWNQPTRVGNDISQEIWRPSLDDSNGLASLTEANLI